MKLNSNIKSEFQIIDFWLLSKGKKELYSALTKIGQQVFFNI